MATPFLYNGQAGVQTDPNGLLNMRARYYSPYLMRFLNADPIGFSGGSNWFAYADGNSISLNDPFGLEAQKCYECHPEADWGKSLGDSYSLIDYTQTAGDAWDDYAPSWMQSIGQEAGRMVSDVGAGALGPNPEMIFAGLGNAVGGAQIYIRARPAANGGARVVSEGIYEFTAASGRTCVGQSGTITERLVQHTVSGKLPTGGVVNTTEVLGGKIARKITEQLRINDLGSVRNLENIRNPITPRDSICCRHDYACSF